MNSLKIPTDLEILETIHKMYYKDFVLYDQDNTIRKAKIFVPIDCLEIANRLNVNGDTVFGRLEYHLEEKYGYNQSESTRVKFFALQLGNDRHCVNFPLLEAVLASLKEERENFWTTTIIASLALILSFISIAFL